MEIVDRNSGSRTRVKLRQERVLERLKANWPKKPKPMVPSQNQKAKLAVTQAEADRHNEEAARVHDARKARHAEQIAILERKLKVA